jgi:hypothetical protein
MEETVWMAFATVAIAVDEVTEKLTSLRLL